MTSSSAPWLYCDIDCNLGRTKKVMTMVDCLRLTFEYWGAPGASGASELSIAKSPTAVRLRYVTDVNDSDDRAWIEELPRECRWREIVAVLEDQEICAFYGDVHDGGEYAYPWKIGLEGSRTFASELIALAWAGPPFSKFARAFAAATNEQIAALHKEAGSFLKMEFVERLIELDKLLLEIDIPLEDLVLQERGPTLNLSTMHGKARERFRELGGEEWLAEQEARKGWKKTSGQQ